MREPNIKILQDTITTNYINHLEQFGYMDDVRTLSSVFSILLLDTFQEFPDFITNEYKRDTMKIINNLGCCNCVVGLM